MQRARQWMVERLSEKAAIQNLAQYLGVSVTRLHGLTGSKAGTSPAALFHDMRMQHCKRLLQSGTYTVKRVAYENGYQHANDFSRAFKKHFGMPPRQVGRDT